MFPGIARQGRDGGLYGQTPDLCRCLVLTGWLGSWTGQTASMCTKVLCSLNTPPPRHFLQTLIFRVIIFGGKIPAGIPSGFVPVLKFDSLNR